MTKQLILPLIPREGVTPKPVEDLLAVIIGLLQSYGYSDQYTVLENGGWHPVSEPPTATGKYMIYSPVNGITEAAYFPVYGWDVYYKITHWQPLPDLPETKEEPR